MEIWKLMGRSATFSIPLSVEPESNTKNLVSDTNSSIMEKITKRPRHLWLTIL